MKEPDARWNLRIRGDLARRFKAAVAKCKADESDTLRQLAEAYAERVERDGGVFIPIEVKGVPSPSSTRENAAPAGKKNLPSDLLGHTDTTPYLNEPPASIPKPSAAAPAGQRAAARPAIQPPPSQPSA